MAKVHFKVSSRTARLIGRENVSNADGAIIELVKNGHDADAKSVVIYFDASDNLYIVDNGHGMTNEVIESAWMTIGTDNKEINPYTPGKRVRSGAKGIGRFALDRLGKSVEMLTLPDKATTGYRWNVEWSQFEKKALTVSDIEADLDEVTDLDLLSEMPPECKAIYDKSVVTGGTVLRIESLRDVWDEETLTKLYQNLEALVPIIEKDSFSIYLISEKHPNKFGLVRPIISDDFDYRLEAKFDSSNKAFHVTVFRNEYDVIALEKRYSGIFSNKLLSKTPFQLEDFKRGQYDKTIAVTSLLPGYVEEDNALEKIGDFSASIIFAKNRLPNAKLQTMYPYKNADYMARTGWLKKFGGVKIFRDHFRVRPYGENGDDWLRLGERRARSPGGAGQSATGFRVAPNQIVGSIHISRIENPELYDKSSREGLMENSTFAQLKSLIIGLLTIIEDDRSSILFSLSELYKETNENEEKKQKARDIASRLKKAESKTEVSAESQKEDIKVLADANDVLVSEVEDYKEENKILRSLASAGLITAAAAHELRGLENILTTRTRDFRVLLAAHITPEDASKLDEEMNPYILLDDMEASDKKIREWLNYALMPLRRDKRRQMLINLADYLTQAKETWHNLLEDRTIKMTVAASSDNLAVNMFPIDVDTIINNLVINSVESFARQKGRTDRLIDVKASDDGEWVQIVYKDNGSGLDASFHENPADIFLPQKTTKRDKAGNPIGTGMGMYLVKSVVDENKGLVEITEINSGFELTIKLKKTQVKHG